MAENSKAENRAGTERIKQELAAAGESPGLRKAREKVATRQNAEETLSARGVRLDVKNPKEIADLKQELNEVYGDFGAELEKYQKEAFEAEQAAVKTADEAYEKKYQEAYNPTKTAEDLKRERLEFDKLLAEAYYEEQATEQELNKGYEEKYQEVYSPPKKEKTPEKPGIAKGMAGGLWNTAYVGVGEILRITGHVIKWTFKKALGKETSWKEMLQELFGEDKRK